jgi:hypothetical protein
MSLLWTDIKDKSDDLSRVLSDCRKVFEQCGTPEIVKDENGRYQLGFFLTSPALRAKGLSGRMSRIPDHLGLVKPGDEGRLESCSEIIVSCRQSMEADFPERVLANMAAGIRYRFVFCVEDLGAVWNLLRALATGSKYFDNQDDYELLAVNLARLKTHLTVILVEDIPWYEYLIAINPEHHVRAAVYLRRPGTDECFLYASGPHAQDVVRRLERPWTTTAKSRLTYGVFQASRDAADRLKSQMQVWFQGDDLIVRELGLLPSPTKPGGSYREETEGQAARLA